MSQKLNISYNKAALGFLAFLVFFTVTGFFILPPIVKSVLTSKLAEQLHRPVSIDKVKINPFMLSVEINGFIIREPQGGKPFVSFGKLYVNAQSITLFKGGLVLREVRLEKPYIHIVRNSDLSYNFSDLIKTDEKKQPSTPLLFSLSNIQILNGGIAFEDAPKKTVHTVKDLNFSIPFVSNLPYFFDTFVQPGFEAIVNGTPVVLKGQTKPFKDSLETSFQINIKDLNIPYYLAYVPVETKARLKSAFFSMTGVLAYTQYTTDSKPPTISLTGDLGIRKLELADAKDQPVLSLPALDIGIAASDLLATKVHFSKILLDSPDLNVVRNSAGEINLTALLPPKKEGAKIEEKEKEGRETIIEADEIVLKSGKVSFSDVPNGHAFKKTLTPIDLQIHHFSTEKDKKSAIILSMLTELKESVKVEGEFSTAPLASAGDVSIGGIQLKSYAPYYRDRVLFTLKDGTLDFSTHYTLAKNESNVDVVLSSLETAVKALKLRKNGEEGDFLNIPTIGVKGTTVDLAKQEVTVGELITQKGVVSARRTADGLLNLAQLVPPSQETQEPSSGKMPEKPGKPWLVNVRDLRIDQYTVKGEDLVPAEPVKISLEKISLRGSNLSTGLNKAGKVSLSLTADSGGTFSSSGQMTINPLSADLKVKCADLRITPFQPYFTDRVKIIVTDGQVSASGDIALRKAGQGLNVSYQGEAALSRFASLDKAEAEDFLKWNSLHAGGILAQTQPFSLHINEIALADFYSRLVVTPDGTLNVQNVLAKEEGGKEAKEKTEVKETAEIKTSATKESTGKKLITINRVTLQGGTVNFTDNYIKPHYSANLLEIGGRISGLSSMEETFADVDLKGRLDNYAPLEITGKINPLREDLFVDLKVDFKDIELSPFTPYSGKYIGYTIQKGKLALGLQYAIAKRKLDAQNRVFLDQFTLGEQVESPQATKLPVRLAIALLKNSKGEINLDLPVSGSLDDPQFRVGGIIIKILVNLLMKAATSPFALLGAIFGGGEELSYLDFDYGLSSINESGTKKIDTLVKALADRPGLKLEITGHVDMEKDREGLRQYFFDKKIKAQKLKEMLKKGQPAVPVDEVNVAPEEYGKYLKAAYGEEKFPKPRNVLGFAKDLPAPEMEKLMLTHVQITDSDLRQLVSQRAQQVKDHLLKSGQVASERIFLIEPKTLQPEKKEKMRDSRVDFSLK